jgi:acyl-coenzyme A thioesterase PaaI-like protein
VTEDRRKIKAMDDQEFSIRSDMAESLRTLIKAAVALEIPKEKLFSYAEQLKSLAEEIKLTYVDKRIPRYYKEPGEDMRLDSIFPSSPISGAHNAYAPPIKMWIQDGAVYAEGAFDYQHEGPPGCVHGGVIALVFDTTLGAASMLAGIPVMTGTLTVRYVKPTPIKERLEMEARYLKTEGKKVFVQGTISFNNEVTAKAEGIWVAISPERIAQYQKLEG